MESIRNVRITSEKIGDAEVTESKFSEHLEHGSISNISKGGRYVSFDTAFGAAPHIVLSGESETAGTYVTLGTRPATGSFNVKLAADGTLSGHYMAWGQR